MMAVSSVDYPGAYDGIFAVGATDGLNDITDYSNRGAALDLVAPGGRLEADANGDGQPDGVISTYVSEERPEYVFLQGTSMATPHVAGVFALMKSVYADLNADIVDDLLQLGALTDDLGDTGRDDTYGWGLINARKAVTAAISYAGGEIDIPPRLGVSTSLLNFGSTSEHQPTWWSLIRVAEKCLLSMSRKQPRLVINHRRKYRRKLDLGRWRFSVDRPGTEPRGPIVLTSPSNRLPEICISIGGNPSQ
jgi:serine protease